MAIRIPPILVAIFFSTNGLSYAFTSDFNKGFYWKTFPIVMNRFATDSTDAGLIQTLSDQAINDWESVTGKNLWTFNPVVISSNYTGNYIKWSNNFGQETGFDPNSTLAVTIRYNKGTFMETTVIILNAGLAYLKQNWGNSLKITLLHEIGHTIGLDHTAVVGAIMYPSIGTTTSLQPDDIEGMNALVDQTLNRQSTGYISPYSTTTSTNKIAACGTVEDIARNNGDRGSNSMTNFMGAILMGIGITFVSKKIKIIG